MAGCALAPLVPRAVLDTELFYALISTVERIDRLGLVAVVALVQVTLAYELARRHAVEG